jgi:hypothetical protein
MEVSTLKQKALTTGKILLTRLSHFKPVFALSSLVYCAVHWIVSQSFSIVVFLGALVVGVLVATVVAWLSDWLSSSSA